ncbi:hypothetical protein HAX54_005526 [Datura stramonium]|uniref:Uncharacterized protein n=1 Tax=Datura stramonium TaxID=4076 RepID=A0ABS8T9P3_DATST|nr:hypothetical protein [Datura stramonium]
MFDHGNHSNTALTYTSAPVTTPLTLRTCAGIHRQRCTESQGPATVRLVKLPADAQHQLESVEKELRISKKTRGSISSKRLVTVVIHVLDLTFLALEGIFSHSASLASVKDQFEVVHEELNFFEPFIMSIAEQGNNKNNELQSLVKESLIRLIVMSTYLIVLAITDTS